MKKSILFLALLVTSFGYSQENDDSTSKKTIADLYIGIGAQVHDDYNLNNKLRMSNVAELKTVSPEFTVGLNVFGEKYSGDVEFGFLYSKNSEGNTKNQVMGFSTRLRVHYNLVNQDKFAFTSGLNISSTSSEIDIYSRNNVIDFNDLNPANNGGHINLRNQTFYTGPSIAFYFFKDKKTKLRINAGYELAFTNGKWKSDFASTENRVKENGNNRFVFGISLL